MTHVAATNRNPPRWPDAAGAAQGPWAQLLALLAVVLLTGCAALPAEVQRAPSLALHDVADTDLARLAAAATPPGERGLSGLHLLSDAGQALDARISLARRAQRSLDVQYYLIAADDTGRAFLSELRDAAARGVRVRLLVDDLHVAEQEPALAALAAHDRIEVRLFNPLPARRGAFTSRMLMSLHDFDRINRRMHNKLFIADNRWAVTGGRNIGDEYFMRGDVANFVDMDLLSTGPVVGELSALFDRFWNNELSFPIGSVVDLPGTAQQAREQFDRLVRSRGPRAAEGAASAVGWQIDDAVGALVFAPVAVYADAPTKALASASIEAAPATAMERTLKLFMSARSEVQITSPYFVPGPNGMAMMREAVDKGIRISVTTNSLAATDEPLAHWGYARYRLEMLKMGIAVAERKARPADRGAGLFSEPHSSLSRLHAKLGVVDRRWLVVGSMNMDLRSSRANTEIVLAVDSAELASQLTQWQQQRWAPGNYRLRLSDSGRQVVWLEPDGDAARVYSAEPQLGWLARTRLGLVSMFIAEELL
jgi:cardiolipin synthase C